MPSEFHDADAEAVREKAREEAMEDREMAAMAGHDPLFNKKLIAPVVTGGATPGPTLEDIEEELAAEEDMDIKSLDHAPSTPREIPETPRAHEPNQPTEEEREPKKARIEDNKKQRIIQLRERNERMIRSVKMADDEFFTMDSYDQELLLADEVEDEAWHDEDTLAFGHVPEQLWSDFPLDVQPPPPEKWIDDLADSVEIQRLIKMQVLDYLEKFQKETEGTLTVKSVYDWRIKERMKW